MTFKWFVASYLMLSQLKQSKEKKNPSSLFLFKWSFSKKSHEVYCFVWQDCPHHTECPLTWPACAHFLCTAFNQDVCLRYTSPGQSPNKQFNIQGREYKFNRKSANAKHSNLKIPAYHLLQKNLSSFFHKKNSIKKREKINTKCTRLCWKKRANCSFYKSMLS